MFAAGTVVSTDYFLNHILPSLWERFSEIVAAPFRNPEMLWITLPLIIILLMMEFYFGRYRNEELGWNTAVGNSLVLVFVSLDLLRQVYGSAPLSAFSDVFLLNITRTGIAAAVGFSGLLLFYTDFFHITPKWLAFKVSSPLAVNFVAYLSIVIIYTGIALDTYTLIAAMLLFMLLVALFAAIHFVEPKAGFSRASKADRVLGMLLRPLEKPQRKKRRKRRMA